MKAIIAGETWNAGERVDLATTVAAITHEIGQEIIDTATQYWGAGAATMRKILICGGGAHLWGDMLRRAFRQAVVLPQPELANASGFFRFACNIAK